MSNAAMYRDEGMKNYNRGALKPATEAFEKALAEYEAQGQADMVAEMRANLGVIARDQKRYEDARALLSEAVSVFESMGDSLRAAMARGNLAGVVSSLGDKEAAYDLYVQAADVFQELGQTAMHRDTLKAMATLQIKRGKVEMGRQIMTEAVNMGEADTFLRRLQRAAFNIFTFRWLRLLLRR